MSNLDKKLQWAKLFHDTYEEQAPFFGYITRKDTRKFNPKSQNGKLMIKVCEIVATKILQEQKEEILRRLPKERKLPKNAKMIFGALELEKEKLRNQGWNVCVKEFYRRIKIIKDD